MNLADHFEPMPMPESGLRRVRRTARKRAVVQQLSSGAAAFVLLLVIAGGLHVTVEWFFQPGEPVTDDRSTATMSEKRSENDTAGASDGFVGLTPDPNGLPGGTTVLQTTGDTIFYALVLGLGLIVIVTAVGVTHALRSGEPQLRGSENDESPRKRRGFRNK